MIKQKRKNILENKKSSNHKFLFDSKIIILSSQEPYIICGYLFHKTYIINSVLSIDINNKRKCFHLKKYFSCLKDEKVSFSEKELMGQSGC